MIICDYVTCVREHVRTCVRVIACMCACVYVSGYGYDAFLSDADNKVAEHVLSSIATSASMRL